MRAAGCAVSVVAAVLLGVAGVSACSSSGPKPPGPPGPQVGQQVQLSVPATVAASTLVTPGAGITSLRSLRGKVVVVSDMMTLCQETCPLDTANVVAAARAVEHAGLGSKVEFLSITIDPQRDTPTQLAAYRREFSPAPADWLTATGSPQVLAALWARLGVFIQKVRDTPPAPRNWFTGAPLTYDLTHSDEVFFFDASGTERYLLEGAPHLAPGQSISSALYRFMDSQGHRNVTEPDAASWSLGQELAVLSWLTGHRIPA